MTPEQIKAADARLFELNQESDELRKLSDRCLAQMQELRVQFRTASAAAVQGRQAAEESLSLAKQKARAITEKAQAEAARTLEEAAISYELAVKTVELPLESIKAQVQSLEEERQNADMRRSRLKEDYGMLHETVGNAKKERAREEALAAKQAADKPVE